MTSYFHYIYVFVIVFNAIILFLYFKDYKNKTVRELKTKNDKIKLLLLSLPILLTVFHFQLQSLNNFYNDFSNTILDEYDQRFYVINDVKDTEQEFLAILQDADSKQWIPLYRTDNYRFNPFIKLKPNQKIKTYFFIDKKNRETYSKLGLISISETKIEKPKENNQSENKSENKSKDKKSKDKKSKDKKSKDKNTVAKNSKSQKNNTNKTKIQDSDTLMNVMFFELPTQPVKVYSSDFKGNLLQKEVKINNTFEYIKLISFLVIIGYLILFILFSAHQYLKFLFYFLNGAAVIWLGYCIYEIIIYIVYFIF